MSAARYAHRHCRGAAGPRCSLRHIACVRPSFSAGATNLPVRPPAVGKYTIGVELAERTGFRLLHNHLTVNLVSAVFERDSDVWLRLLRSVRRDMLTGAARNGVDLIMTSVFNGTSENAEAWRIMIEPVEAEGGSVLFVQSTCARDELFRRVEQEGRRALDKLVDTVRLSELLGCFDMFSPAPFGRHLCLDVTHVAPSEAATAIIQHYDIDYR